MKVRVQPVFSDEGFSFPASQIKNWKAPLMQGMDDADGPVANIDNTILESLLWNCYQIS